ncbi:hypothetical protein [Janthinobacterium sp. CG_23.3]|uniref:hypothetical protein n=1 Tax=Janthinobacterium sp. CG_23.3 TaxID=3349634 RepID=UPI0038D4ED09
MKGAAATLSAQALAQAAETLELQARRREPAAMPAALALLAAEAAALAAELVSYCGDGL